MCVSVGEWSYVWVSECRLPVCVGVCVLVRVCM